jgi:hypothetical protein
MPWFVLFTSNMALGCGVEPSVVMATWACKIRGEINMAHEQKKIMEFFMAMSLVN